jgi:DNA-directed RNA polymerase subunit RPC12/RpoP
MSEFTLACPECSNDILLTDEWIGHEAECPTCGQKFTVPKQTPVIKQVATKSAFRKKTSTSQRKPKTTGQTQSTTKSSQGTVNQQSPTKVKVVDIEMGFGSMVVFIIKWTLASIPAMIILFLIVLLISLVFGGLLGALFSVFGR